ncbi:MAG TPA: lipid-A-disaccharide synthase, partial [Phaeodactylibacter sp.]|nr:lipid-A-disaccharide synthase [Phaeodactylibacter sp.]
MRYFLIAGEASGDMHAARLMQALKARDAHAEFFFFGGNEMQAAGGQLLLHYRQMAFMGFWEVVKNLRSIAKNLRLAKEEIRRCRPDALILIDFPGFNLRIADWAKKQGLKVFYYISPQIWAWKEKRV